MSYVDAMQWLGGLLVGVALCRAGWRALRGRPGGADPFGNRRLFVQRRRARWS